MSNEYIHLNSNHLSIDNKKKKRKKKNEHIHTNIQQQLHMCDAMYRESGKSRINIQSEKKMEHFTKNFWLLCYFSILGYLTFTVFHWLTLQFFFKYVCSLTTFSFLYFLSFRSFSSMWYTTSNQDGEV